jgi:hypothetical protein
VGASYFSEGGLYPGFTLNYELTLLHSDRFHFLVNAKTGAYFHKRNHTGIMLMVQGGQRFRLVRQLYFENFLGIGYLHTFINGGDIYYVNASGQVVKEHAIGNPHFMPSVMIGLSYQIKHHDKSYMIFGRPIVFWQIPFNKSSLVQYGFETGILLQLHHE